MATMGQIRRALVERLGNLPDFTAYPFIPDAINAPAAFVEPARPFVDYQQAFGGAGTEWKFIVTILVNRVDEESAQDAIDEYLDPDGQFVEVLQARGLGDSLSEIAQYVEVMSATRYGAYRVGGVMYFGAQLMLTVRA